MTQTGLTLRVGGPSARHSVGEQGRGSERDYRRFYAKVRVDPSGCWLWTGAKYRVAGKDTYGQSSIDGKRTGAHRVSYVLHRGALVDGLDVMHSCNVKACVNPDHLSLGTRSQNLRDGFRDNPGVCAGENNGRARLTWDDVRAIRAAQGTTKATALARRYGVSETHVRLIWRGLKWPEPVAEQGEVAA